MKTAVCTIVVGERYTRLFDRYVFRSLKKYCKSHRFELIVFRQPFRDLGAKSIAWQKLFILDQAELRGFDKVIWLDADIIIREGAPPIKTPPGLIGYVQERPYRRTVEEWYRGFSLIPAPDVVQTGVLCLEPSHSEILRSAANAPETSMYEMPALSREISASGLGYHLDPRYNALLAQLMLDYAPYWILASKPVKEMFWVLGYKPLRRAIREVCDDNWFIHAAGAKRDLIKVSRYLAARSPRAIA